MTFKPYDIYTSSGSAAIFNSWTTPVTKFDPSSFYNWEQDNEPIHDLEERTYLNWEHAGFHTSTVPGMVFTVSGPGAGDPGPPAATLAANPNLFTTVSAAVEALPSDIRFPVLIEVANFGNLGNLNLNNINIGYGGSLEIINRNFVKAYALSGGPQIPEGSLEPTCRINRLSSNGKVDQYRMIDSISSLDASNTWEESKAVHINTPVLSSTISDGRLINNINSVFQPFPSGLGSTTTQGYSRLTASIGGTLSSVANTFTVAPFETTSESDDAPHKVKYYDVSAKDILHSTPYELIMGPAEGVSYYNQAQGMMYGNYLTRLKVNNCNGPIYLRNFFINSSDHNVDGVAVFDSNDVWIENCASVKNRVGFNFKNSKVFINRGIVAYRNYGVDVNGNRKTGYWGQVSSTPASLFSDNGAGLKASNSEIIFNTAGSIYGRQGSDRCTFEGYTAAGAIQSPFEHQVYPIEFMINFSRNSVGISLDNSVMRGGWPGKADHYLSGVHFNVELNNEYGIHAKNSVLDLDGRLRVLGNSRGALLENSKAILNECVFRVNQHEGLHAVNSNIQYNKNLQQISFARSPNNLEYQFDFSGNGRHLVLDQGSTFVPTVASSMPAKYGQMRFADNHGITTSSINKWSRFLPPIDVKNNSKATLVHSTIKSFPKLDSITSTMGRGIPIYGECISVNNNSKVLLQGSVSGASVVHGSVESGAAADNSTGYTAHRRSAGVYVANNSELECNGPTVMFNFGVDALAENNSVISFNPPKAHETGGIDPSGWDLNNPRNHTSVELHSVNSCLVANKNSTINMKDLGDYHLCWSGNVENPAAHDYDTGTGGFDTSNFTSAGSMQFYPNPNGDDFYEHKVDAVTDPAGAIENPWQGSVGSNNQFQVTGGGVEGGLPRNYYLDSKAFVADEYSVSSTAGGNCVRALGGSHVNVLNVNFPAGWWNASGLIYDVSGADRGAGAANLCNRTFIWNIADTSRLHAAFCSVSGLEPNTVGYNGPSAVYFVDDTAQYNAPSSTPDTSSLSVLDFFGQGSNNTANWPIPQFSSIPGFLNAGGTGVAAGFMSYQMSGAQSTFRNYGISGTSLENRGPFRLYVSVDPVANYFSSIEVSSAKTVINDGYARQLYAQGYNLSGPVSAGPMGFSSVYGNTVKIRSYEHPDGPDVLNQSLSGFVYNNEVVDPTTFNRILLDESAAHIFANAKNGAMGTSNRAKICKIYVSRTSPNAEMASLSTEKTFGKGYTSPDVFDLERDGSN